MSEPPEITENHFEHLNKLIHSDDEENEQW
jgi:hypothetical protein